MPPAMPPPPGLGSYPPPTATAFPPPGPFVDPSTPRSTGGLPLAHWGLRLGGFAIDGVLFVVVQRILQAILRHNNTLRVNWTMQRTGSVPQHLTLSFLAVLLAALIFVLYGTIMIGTRGQSLGMMAVGIKTVRAEDDATVGLGRALGRSVVQVLLTATVIIGLISDLFPLWDARRQTLQDKAVNTLVVRSRAVR
jgi:uncharacterized RDD family membrane protein YckC